MVTFVSVVFSRLVLLASARNPSFAASASFTTFVLFLLADYQSQQKKAPQATPAGLNVLLTVKLLKFTC